MKFGNYNLIAAFSAILALISSNLMMGNTIYIKNARVGDADTKTMWIEYKDPTTNESLRLAAIPDEELKLVFDKKLESITIRSPRGTGKHVSAESLKKYKSNKDLQITIQDKTDATRGEKQYTVDIKELSGEVTPFKAMTT